MKGFYLTVEAFFFDKMMWFYTIGFDDLSMWFN